jgi:N12 class adenine-specific DNA methylase
MLDLDLMLHKNKTAEPKAIAEDQDPYCNLMVAVFERAVKDLRSQDSDSRKNAAYNRRLATEWIESGYFVEFCAEFMDYDKSRVVAIRRALGIQPRP